MAAATDQELLYHRTLLPYRPAPVPTCSTGCHSSPQQNEYARLSSRNYSYETPALDAVRNRRAQFSTKGPSFNAVDGAKEARELEKQQEPQQSGFYDSRQRRFNALIYIGGVLNPQIIVEKLDQNFKNYATPWEQKYSALCGTTNTFLPIVDANWTVIGHYGAVSGASLIEPGAVGYWTGTDLSEILKKVPVFVSGRQHSSPPKIRGGMNQVEIAQALADWKADPRPKPWGEFAPSLDVFAVATSIDGEVLGGEKIYDDSEAIAERASWKGVLLDMGQAILFAADLVMDVLLVAELADLVIKGGNLFVKSLVRRQMRRAALRGATEELGAKFAKSETQALSKALKLSRGYDPRMGIPEEHLTKMIEAAKETDSIAIFRANKSAAIPLIRQGAPGKGKYFTFKSSKTTGVLMATEPAHVATAYKNGYFVVDADGVARNVVGGVTKELQLKNPFWTVEKGQVIAPNGKPVVGDYDLLGVIPRKSPGSNVVGVPKDPAKGDWMGPYVEKYAKVVNSKLDQPRVLHGAQDQFHHPQYGGLTDDTAYAVFPDGSTYVMEGRAAQEAFYKAYGRQTIMGQYPRPSPGTPVKDEVAAMRARKQGVK